MKSYKLKILTELRPLTTKTFWLFFQDFDKSIWPTNQIDSPKMKDFHQKKSVGNPQISVKSHAWNSTTTQSHFTGAGWLLLLCRSTWKKSLSSLLFKVAKKAWQKPKQQQSIKIQNSFLPTSTAFCDLRTIEKWLRITYLHKVMHVNFF